tara:strand:+ start:2882 stop:3076 length:195 start_codon:yes stop_codon:yes gene_type:complete
MAKKWIQKAKLKEGAFTKKAKAAGMGVQAFANKVLKKGSKATTKTKRQAALARTFKKMANRRKG